MLTSPRESPVLDVMTQVRERTFELVAHLSDAERERALAPVLGPLVWDLGHIAAYEDLWLNHRLAGNPLLRPGLAELYDAFETPRGVRAELDLLRGEELDEYMAEVRERASGVPVGDGRLHEMVLRHELQHTETMLQAMAFGGRLPAGRGTPAPVRGDDAWVDVDGGPTPIGAPAERFSYDNERPRHRVDVPAFRIARRPVTNATWLHFCEGGGFERREWWSDEGWAWKEEYDIGADHAPIEAALRDPDAPVVHVSWFEAAAFARAHGARLPTEVEWEKAAASEQLAGIGEVWEWTASAFTGYPGFRAEPYREYSEVFFGDRYRVLRGWSCCTAERCRSVHQRNWDRPQRRQLFAGLRLAQDG